MQSSVIIGFAILACVYAQVSQAPLVKGKQSIHYYLVKNSRHTRDTTGDKQVGDGKIFGTLGNKDDGRLTGKASYKQDIFNDQRGKLTGGAYGARVLGGDGW